jgi:hypothetical protein
MNELRAAGEPICTADCKKGLRRHHQDFKEIQRLLAEYKLHPSAIMRLLISASRGSSLAIDYCPPVENVASLVNGFLIHVVVSHRHLHVTVA